MKDQWNSVDTDSLKKSVSGYLTRSPQAQTDVTDKDSVSSENAPSITELSEVSDTDVTGRKTRTRKSRELQELESRLEEQVKLKNRMADMLEQQQDKFKAESREAKRVFELKLQDQHSKLSEEISKKDKLLDKSKLIIHELNKNIQDLQKDNEMSSVQQAMDVDRLKKEAAQSSDKMKQFEGERQVTRDESDTLRQKCTDLESQVKRIAQLEEVNSKQAKEMSAMRDVIQNSTDESEQKFQLLLRQVTSERDDIKREYTLLQQQETESKREHLHTQKQLQDSIHSIETELSESKSVVSRLEQDREAAIREGDIQISALEKEVGKVKSELKRSQRQSDQEQTVTDKSLSESKQLLQGKEEEIVRLSGEGERQALQISKLQKDSDRNVQELKSSLHKEKMGIDELRGIIDQVKLEKSHEIEAIYTLHDEEKQRLIDQNSELKKSVSDTQEQLLAVTSSSLTANQKYKNELAKVEKDKRSMEEQVIKAKNERMELQQRSLELEKKMKAHKSAEEGWKTEFEEATGIQDKNKKEMERLEMTLELLNKELSGSKKDAQEKQVELQTLLTLSRQQQELERAELFQSVDGLNNQIKILDETILSNSDRSRQLSEQLEQVQGESRQIQESLQTEIGRLNKQLTDSEQTLSVAISVREDALIELSTAKQMIEHKNDNLKNVLQERNSLHTQFSDTQQELASSVKQREELAQNNIALEQQIQGLSEKLLYLQTTLREGVDGMWEGVSAKLIGFESNISRLEGKLEGVSRLREEMSGLRDKLAALEQENNEYQERLQKKSLEIKQLQQRQTDLKKVMSRELKMQSSQYEIITHEQQLAACSELNGSLDTAPILSIEATQSNIAIYQDRDNYSHPVKSTSTLSLPLLSNEEHDLIDLSLQSPIGEINFQYLRNIMLQYMCSTPVEAKQLHKALFTLLRVSSREQASINQFWSYRESWFVLKAPPKFRSIIPESKEL